MGFFSGLTKTLTGGSDSSSSSSSGFAQLPAEIRNAYTGYATDTRNLFGGGAANNLFEPLDVTEAEQQALDSINRGFAATPESLADDIAMQLNPFDDYVIAGINDAANSDFSILKQNATQAGQFGSNRQELGANDIELKRQEQIGRFKQDQYNKALDNSLNQLTETRARDAGLQMEGGAFLRDLDLQRNLAPVTANAAYGQAVGILPTDGGSQSRSNSSSVGGFSSFF